jgi:hypothetical protein
MEASKERLEAVLREWRGAPCVFREMMCFARGSCERLDWDGRTLKLEVKPDGKPGYWWPATEAPSYSATREDLLVAPSLLVLRGAPVVVHFDLELIGAVGEMVDRMPDEDMRDRNVATLRLLLAREAAVLGFIPS